MKACSFLPAATQMIYDMGLQHMLEAVTFECPPQALAEKPAVVRCYLEGKNYSSIQIDTIFSKSKSEGKSLYYVEETLLQEIQPDVIFTQDVCEVCQIDTETTARAVDKLDKEVKLVALLPQSLTDVFDTALTIAKALDKEENAYVYLETLNKRLKNILDTLRAHNAPLKRISLLEWVDPIYNCGHWIPHQIAYAGGVDMLSNPSGDSIVTEWQKIVAYDPEVLIIAPCGFDTHRSLKEMEILSSKKEWAQLKAVQNNAVFIADFDLFTQPSASTLVDGIELLASLFHPEIFELPQALKRKVQHFTQLEPTF